MTPIIVISDKFERFLNKPGLIPYSALLKALRCGRVSELRGRRIFAGQGLDEMDIDHAYCLAISGGLESEFSQWRKWRGTSLADQQLCHKHRPENVLISAPTRVKESLFTADLLVQAGNELLQDHLTGEHIQGMVLVEACR